PIQELRAAVRAGYFDAVMGTTQADTLLHQISEDPRMAALNGGMTRPAIRINQHRVGAIEGGWFLGPAVGVDDGRDPWHFFETMVKEKATRPELVLAGTVAGFASDENDSLVGANGVERPEGHGEREYAG